MPAPISVTASAQNACSSRISRVIRVLMGLCAFASLMATASPLPAQGLATVPVSAQGLRGRVENEAGRPLVAVRVSVVELQRRAATDSAGRFVLEGLPGGSYSISFERTGLVPEVRSIRIRPNETTTLTVRMRESRVELAVVQVSASALATTTSRATQPATVLGGGMLRNSQAASVGETLAGVAGMRSISLSTGIGKPVIRGLHSTRVVTMVDGNRVDGQQWGTDHGPNAETATADRVEVIKGPASVLYGSEAIGGVINILPRALPWDGANGQTGVTGRLITSYNTNVRSPDVTVSAEAGHGRVAWRAIGTGRSAQNMRTAKSALSNTRSDAGFGELTAGVRPSWGEVRMSASTKEERIEIYDDPITNPDFSGFQRLSTRRATLFAERPTARGQLDLRVSAEQNYRREFAAAGATVPDLGLLATSWNGRATLTHAPVLGGWRGTVGATAARGVFEKRGIKTLIPSNSTRALGAFVFEQRERGRLNLSVGARADWQALGVEQDSVLGLSAQRRTFGAFTGTAGAAWQLAGPFAVAANVGRGFRAPVVQELFANGFHEGSRAFERGDSTVRVETSLNVDVAVRAQSRAFRGEVTVFRNAIANYIYLRPFGGDGFLFDSLQVVQGNALLVGAEATAEYRPIDRFSLAFGADYVRGTNTTTGRPLLFIPPVRGTVSARVDGKRLRGLQRPYASLSGEANRRQTRTEQRDFAPAGAMLAHGAVGAVWLAGARLVTIDVTARNLLNTRFRDYMSRYKEFADAPGRAVVVRLSAEF